MKLIMSGEKLNNIFNSASQYRDEGLVKINEEQILIKVMDPSEAAQFACLIPNDAMYEFDNRGVNEIAISYDTLTDFIPSTDDEVKLIYEDFNNVNKLVVMHEGSETRVPTIDKGDVPDVQTSIPTFDMPVEITSEPNFLMDFISKCNTINTDNFMISPREKILYLYSERNDNELIERIPRENFTDYDIDWNKGNVPEDIPNATNPAETHEVDVTLSTELTGDMQFWTDAAVFQIDHHMPFKTVFEDEDGIKVSWMIAPRVPTEGQSMTLPDNVIQQRGLEEMIT